MKTTPILFSGPMVRAILDGRKTMTRRVCKVQPCGDGYRVEHVSECVTIPGVHLGNYCFRRDSGDGIGMNRSEWFDCPFGTVGDRLWVREAFSMVPCSAGVEKFPEGFDPKKSSASQPNAPGYGVRYKSTWDRSHSCGWKPSIHMPRWASRITLEITGVRVERLQDIRESDAKAEGCPDDQKIEVPGGLKKLCLSGGHWFQTLWGQINGKTCPWSSNPWVWVVSFRRVTEVC